MAVLEHTTIFPGDAVWYRIPRVYINDVLMTDLNPPDSFTVEVLPAAGGPAVLSGVMSHSADVNGLWEFQFNAPSAGTWDVKAVATKVTRTGRFKDSFVVTAY